MSEFRPIDATGYPRFAVPTSFGRPARLQWIEVKKLVIDPAYQRDIVGKGRVNVGRIALAFNWTMFTPVVLAAVSGGRFAIVDGQHRVTAAALCGIDKVPCCIIEAKRAEQAAAFRAINGTVTRLHSMAIHHAALAAGDPEAVLVDKTCRRADVVVLRYPKPWDVIEVGETMAVVAIRRAIRQFGPDCVATALRAIRDSGDGNAGMLRIQTIQGVAEVLNDHAEWREAGGALIDAFDNIDLAQMYEHAKTAATKVRGSSLTEQFEALLVEALTEQFKKQKPQRKRA